jgi:exosortase/archaeosortase family protein
MNKLISKITPKDKFILLFLLKALLLYLVWFCTYDLWLKKVGVLDNLIVDNLVYLSVQFLDFFDYLLYVDHHKVGIHGAYSSVFVGKGCNALELFALFTGFILIFEGNWKHKLWFIPLGVLVIHLLNVVRILALIFSGTVSQSFLEFNHKYTFTIAMYIVTFIGWMVWVKYFASKAKVVDEKTES